MLASPTAKVWKYCLSSLFQKKNKQSLRLSQIHTGTLEKLDPGKEQALQKAASIPREMYPWNTLSIGHPTPRLQVYWTCLWQMWDSYCTKQPCALPVWGSSPDVYVPHCCNGSSIAKSTWHQRSSSHWSLRALMVAPSFSIYCFNLAWSVAAELEVICPFRGEHLACVSLVGKAEQWRWKDCLEKQELPSKPDPQHLSAENCHNLLAARAFTLDTKKW